MQKPDLSPKVAIKNLSQKEAQGFGQAQVSAHIIPKSEQKLRIQKLRQKIKEDNENRPETHIESQLNKYNI